MDTKDVFFDSISCHVSSMLPTSSIRTECRNSKDEKQ